MLALALLGCRAIGQLPGRFFDRRTPRERYEASLDAAGLAETGLVRDWRGAGLRALAAAPGVTLPLEEQGYFAAGEPAALSWRVAVRRGQRLSLDVRFDADSTALLFIEVWRDHPDGAGAFHRVAAADSGERSLSWSRRQDGDLIIRVQPELLRGGRFAVRLGLAPVLAFPVERRGERDIGSRFGAPRDGGRRDHHGIDIFAPRGSPALAGADGVVRRVETTTIGGNVVWLRDRDGHSLYYAHLDRQSVVEGQEIRAGDTVGFIGNSGNAITSPPHLHFGVYSRGEGPLDPWWFVHRPRGTPPKLVADTLVLGSWLRTPSAGAKLLSRPVARETPLRALPGHTPLRVLAAVGHWFRVRLPDGETGFVVARELESLDRPIEVASVDSAMNVLQAPDVQRVSERVLGELRPGGAVEVYGRFGEYSLVRSSGTMGWVAGATVRR